VHQINRITRINHDLSAVGCLTMRTRVSSIGRPITHIIRPSQAGSAYSKYRVGLNLE
jgi:hypothetical protein